MQAEPTLRAALEARGALSVAEVLELAARRYGEPDVIGGAGDFVTAPEVSQCFGELLGLWLASLWAEAGSPTPFVLAELGPGRGTLLRDLWRAASLVPGFQTAAEVHLVETSPALRAEQAAALDGVSTVFHATIEGLPEAPLFLVANEFLDALPVHQLVRRGTGWTERWVGVADGAPAWEERPAPATLADTASRIVGAVSEGVICELAPAREAVVEEVASRIVRHGGAALFIDYGAAAPSTRDTLQAVRRHEAVDVLAHLDDADLSTAVSFAPLIEAASRAGAQASGPLPQGRVLRALGLDLRALKLAQAERDAGLRAEVLAGARRLVDAEAMGELFKMLAIRPSGTPPPAGFVAPWELTS